jgi:hypothetical protein
MVSIPFNVKTVRDLLFVIMESVKYSVKSVMVLDIVSIKELN